MTDKLTDDERITRLEVVFTTLISWLPRELGQDAQMKLFSMINDDDAILNLRDDSVDAHMHDKED